MRNTVFFVLMVVCLAGLFTPAGSGSNAGSIKLVVTAGPFDRRDSIVSFELPSELSAKSYALRDESGREIPLQVDGSRDAMFVLAELKAGQSKTFVVEELKTPQRRGGVELVSDHGKLIVSASGKRILAYQTSGELPSPDIRSIFKRGGYIHPVYTPSGRIVTDDYPSDHFHHHGIWFAWTKTEFEGR